MDEGRLTIDASETKPGGLNGKIEEIAGLQTNSVDQRGTYQDN